MAVRTDASGDYLRRSANLPASTAFTMCGWVKIAAIRGGAAQYWGLENNASNASAWILMGYSNGGAFRITQTTGNTGFSSAPTVGEWFFWALVGAGTGAGNARAYWGHANTSTLVVATSSGASFTPAIMTLANSSWLEWVNATWAATKVWDAALTADELERERWTYLPTRQADINLWSPHAPEATERLADYSGNGRTWTAGGTLADEDGPPISWGAQTWVLPYVVAGGGGTNYPQAAAGTLTPNGAIVRNAGKVVAGTLGQAGALVRAVAKSAAGTLTPAGALLRSTAKSVTGALGLSGAVATVRDYIRAVSGTLTPSGALSRGIAKAMSGALTPTGALSRLTAKLVAGAVSFAGAFDAELNAGAQEYEQAAGGTLGLAGTVGKLTAKALAGALTPSGALATLKAASAIVGGTLGLAGAITRSTGKAVDGALSPSGGIARAIAVSRAGALGLAGALAKATAKTFSGALTPAGALAAVRTFLASVGGTLGLSGTIARGTSKLVAGTLATSGAISRGIAKAVGGALTFLGTLLATLDGFISPHIDVAVSDSAVYTVALSDSLAYTIAASDSAVTTLTVSDSSRS